MLFIQNVTKEKCVDSVNNFDGRSRHFADFLHLYKCFSFHFLKNILKCYSLSHKQMFSQNVWNGNSFTFYLSMPANLNQYWATMWMFKNRNSAQCNFFDIAYNQSYINIKCLFSVNLLSFHPLNSYSKTKFTETNFVQ